MFSPKPAGVETPYQSDAAQVTPVQSVYKLVQIPLEREMQSETVFQHTGIWPATSGHGLQGIDNK